ncbi:AAA family ATPase [Bowmanella denitrificans]|uniref:AAA family ATPase n=1 Tax=Bowmanella denitrificans TaxID=366582 RepID=A0ABP3GBP1_9ALTE
MGHKTTLKETQQLEARCEESDISPFEQIRDFESTFHKQMRVGRVLLEDWQSWFTPETAAKYLLDTNITTQFQFHILSRIVTQPWVRRQWLIVSRRNNDVFDWLESIFKPRFRGIVKGFSELADVQSLQWDWLVYTVITLAEAIPYPLQIAKNLARLAELLNLNDAESALLEFALARQLDGDYCRFTDMLIDTDKHGTSGLARMLKQPATSFVKAFNENGVLGTIVLPRIAYLDLDIDYTIRELLLCNGLLTADSLLNAVVSRNPKCHLNKGHYAHLEIDPVINYLAICLKKRERGVNILLYGPPGTGKTQLSRLVAKHANGNLFSVDNLENDLSGRKPSRTSKVRLAQKILSRVDNTMLCVDECEDIFEKTLLGDVSSKIQLNELLEDSVVPTIWITNWIQHIEPSLLRRFDMVVKVDPPTMSQKAKMYRKQLGKLKVAQVFCDRLASHGALTQGHIASAAKVASALGYRQEQAQSCIEALLEGQLQPLGENLEKSGYVSETTYRPELTNLKGDRLVDIQQMLARSKQGRLLLFGPPGTGKTGFAYYLSGLIEMPLHHTRASDLLDPYVGGTEQNIAEVFRKATRESAILLLDEADSLLTDRSLHQRSWETSQVNELLTQIECFQGILIASTNFEQRLDRAMARRFDFKLEFDYLTPDQAAILLLEVSGCKSLPRSAMAKLQTMPRLTPGDFSVIKRKSSLTGQRSVGICLELLAKEHSYKVKGMSRPIGFVH